MRGEPRPLRLKNSGERRIVELLSRIPRIEPDIEIRPLAGAEFEVEWREPPHDLFIPLEVGATGFYADYDPCSREIREATMLWVARRVKVRGMWCLEADGRGGTWDDDRFHIIWGGGGFYRIARGHGYLFEPDPRLREKPHVFPFPRHLGRSANAEATPESQDEPRSAGYRVVTVGGCAYECIRVFSVERDPDHPDEATLDDAYISREGRTVLVRRCQSLASITSAHKGLPEDARQELEALCAPERERITYNDTEFIHWFDILTDASLGPLIGDRVTRRASFHPTWI